MGKKLTAGIFAALGAAACAGAGYTYYLGRNIVFPKTQSHAEEKTWEIEHGLWGDFDSYEKTEYTVAGKDGYTLHCMYLNTAPGSTRYMILSHGYTANMLSMAKYIGVYRNLGFNCIIWDERGHGDNVKAPCSLGNLESADLTHVIDDACSRFGHEIELGLHGESMGSSISLCVLKYRPKVKFVVADCGFSDLYDLIHQLFDEKDQGFMTAPVNEALKLVYGIDMKDTSAKRAVSGSDVPICLIHGAEDTFVVPSHSDILREMAGGYAELHLIDGAAHAQSRKVLGEEKYTEIVKEFLESAGVFENEE